MGLCVCVCVCTVQSYGSAAFELLRETNGIPMAAYREVMSRPWVHFTTNSKSGQHFFRTDDGVCVMYCVSVCAQTCHSTSLTHSVVPSAHPPPFPSQPPVFPTAYPLLRRSASCGHGALPALPASGAFVIKTQSGADSKGLRNFLSPYFHVRFVIVRNPIRLYLCP